MFLDSNNTCKTWMRMKMILLIESIYAPAERKHTGIGIWIKHDGTTTDKSVRTIREDYEETTQMDG
jgi:hypothetical protein